MRCFDDPGSFWFKTFWLWLMIVFVCLWFGVVGSLTHFRRQGFLSGYRMGYTFGHIDAGGKFADRHPVPEPPWCPPN